jgi:flagellar biogenesis protein FliO
MGNEIYTTFVMLLLLVGVLAVIFLFVKKFARKAQKKLNGVELEVVSRIALSQKSHLCIVNADKRKLLIGVTDQNISILSDLTDDPKAKSTVIKKVEEMANAKKPKPIEDDLSFKSFLKSAFSKQKN